MNREILFRGKCAPDSKYAGEWVTGGYVPLSKDITPNDEGLIMRFLGGNTTITYHVDPDTVGQFTGQYDKNDKKIYEGDIVRWDKDQKLYVVEFRSGMFYASVEPCNPHIYGGFPLWFLCEEEQHCEIICNIYDNPELLATK